MVRPLSNDLRKRVIAAVSKGESCRSAALRFGVAVSSVLEGPQRYRAAGSVKPDRMGRQRKSVLDPHSDFIKERIRQTPHLTLHALKDELAARGVAVSHNAVWLFMRREGCRSKKRCSPLSKAASMWPAGGGVDDRGRLALIHSAWSSSTRPGSRPTWFHCADGHRKELAFAASHHMATGAR